MTDNLKNIQSENDPRPESRSLDELKRVTGGVDMEFKPPKPCDLPKDNEVKHRPF